MRFAVRSFHTRHTQHAERCVSINGDKLNFQEKSRRFHALCRCRSEFRLSVEDISHPPCAVCCSSSWSRARWRRSWGGWWCALTTRYNPTPSRSPTPSRVTCTSSAPAPPRGRSSGAPTSTAPPSTNARRYGAKTGACQRHALECFCLGFLKPCLGVDGGAHRSGFSRAGLKIHNDLLAKK